MSGRPFLRARQKAGGLSGWRICSGSTRLMDAHPILNGSLKDIDVYDCKVSELDAIARNAGLADRAAVGAYQVGLVVEAKHIDRNASRVGAQANAIKLSRRPIGVGDGVRAVANVRVGHNLAVRVRAIGEPQPATGKFRKDVCVQPPEVSLLGLGLTGEVRFDLLRYIHLAPYASNERPMPGRMDAARASPMSARMAVSREQNDHPLAPRSVTTAAPDATAACQSLSLRTRWTQQLFSRTHPAGDPAGSGTGALVSPADGTSAPPAGRHMHADFSAHAA